MMFNRPSVVFTPTFNIILIIVGVLAFLLFNFVIEANFMISLMMFIVPIMVAVANLNEKSNDT
ncbi:hypothetical protein [Staphylococcus sp. 11261D007BR]